MALNKIRILLIFLIFYQNELLSQNLFSYKKVDSTVVHFEPDQYNLCQDELEKLSLLKICDSCVLVIKSYSDSVGTENYNLALSEKRANSILSALKYRISVISKIEINNYGETHSYFDNSRKVEVFILKSIQNFKFNVPFKLKINFYSGTNRVKRESNIVLKELHTYLSTCTNKIILKGYVSGSPDMKLSLERTLTIKRYLTQKGIVASRIQCVGMSNKNKLNKEANEKESALNRRVEITILE